MNALPDITPDRLEDAAHDLLSVRSFAATHARVGLAEWIGYHLDDLIATAREYRDRTLAYELDEQASEYLRDGSREAVLYIEEWLAVQEENP